MPLSALSLVAAGVLSTAPPAQAQAASSTRTQSGGSAALCPEVGRQYAIKSSRNVYMQGSDPRHNLAPNTTYSYSKGYSVTNTVSLSVTAKFSSVLDVQLGGSHARQKTVSASQTDGWQNDTGRTAWAQLGALGHAVSFQQYDVVPPCTVKNVLNGTAVVPTSSDWFNHGIL